MDSIDTVTRENMASWKREFVTQRIMEHLEKIKQRIALEMGDPELIKRPTCQMELCELLGYKTCLEDMLTLTADDLDDLIGEKDDNAA